MKVMVVDDEPDMQLLFEKSFRNEVRAGRIEFHFATSGEQALQYLDQQGTADLVLILSDINMPGMSGLELLKRIKARDARLRVFVITAYGDESNQRLARDLGCDDYLTKPVDFGSLKEKIFQ